MRDAGEHSCSSAALGLWCGHRKPEPVLTGGAPWRSASLRLTAYHWAMARVLFVLAAIGITVYAAIDCFRSNDNDVRALPKALWLLLIVVVPLLGGLIWIFFGHQAAPGNQPPRRLRSLGPDDDPDFLRTLDNRQPKPDDDDTKQ